MREGIYHFLTVVTQAIDIPEPILEIGPAKLHRERFERLAGGKSYVSLDANSGVRPSLVGDAMNLPLRSSAVGTVIVCEVLEHVEDPFDVAEEITRVLRPNGVCVASTPYDLQIHNFPRDFFRPSPDALSFLFKSMPSRVVGYQGRPEFPHTSFLLGFMNRAVDTATLSTRLEKELRAKTRDNPWSWMRGIPHLRRNPYIRSLTHFNEFHFEPDS